MKSYKGLIISLLLLITIVGAFAYPIVPYTRFQNVEVRGKLCLSTPTDNAYMPYGEGYAYLVPSATTNATIYPNKAYQLVDVINAPVNSAVTINFIDTSNVHVGDVIVLQGYSPTHTITFVSSPTTIDYSVNASGNQTGGLNTATNNIMLDAGTDWATTTNYIINNTTYSVTLRNNRSILALIFNGSYWVQLFKSICK